MTPTKTVKPKKALGQHFLTDLSVARRIAATLDGFKDIPVLEIGPGMGVLTQYLLENGHDVYAVELDTESVNYLSVHFPQLEGRVYSGDFLKMDLQSLFDGSNFALIGNYPYNISSQIFFRLLEVKDRVPVCSGMLQREVAERLAAKPGTKARGILSVLLQAWYDVEYLFTVNENVFNPPPKVKSGVVRLVRNSVTSLGCDERLFRTVVKTTFGTRRKTIRNSIKALIPQDAQIASDLLALRPEQLSVPQFIELTNLVSEARQN